MCINSSQLLVLVLVRPLTIWELTRQAQAVVCIRLLGIPSLLGIPRLVQTQRMGLTWGLRDSAILSTPQGH